MKKLIGSLMFGLMVVLMTSLVAAADVNVANVACYPESDSYREAIERGQPFGAYIRMSSPTYLENVQVEVSFNGYEHSDHYRIGSTSRVFDMDANTTYIKKFSFDLPENMDLGHYQMRFRVTDRSNLSKTCFVNYHIQSERQLMTFLDTFLTPSSAVEPGHFLQVNALVKNSGQKDQEYVKITAEVPELDLSSGTFYRQVQAENSVDFETLVRIPRNTPAGTYDLVLKANYDQGYELATTTIPFTVLGGSAAAQSASDTSSAASALAGAAGVSPETISDIQELSSGQVRTSPKILPYLKFILPAGIVIIVLVLILLIALIWWKK